MTNTVATSVNSQGVELVLASSSVYRKSLLAKLGIPFKTHSPNIDETQLPDEDATALVCRLARQKALKTAEYFGNHANDLVVIGSDQVATLINGKGETVILGKPGNKENAIAQLMECSNKTVSFKTGLCVYHSGTQQTETLCDSFEVVFRPLSRQQANKYIDKESPLDCAGSFKSEGLGIRLFSAMNGTDPNSLIGLPLIKLTTLLLQCGIDPLDY